MRKRDELSDPRSCLNRAKDDEWLFVLIGRDEDAPETVRFWARRRVARGKRRADDPQIVEALAWADAVEAEQAQARRAELAEKKARGALGAGEADEFAALQAAQFGPSDGPRGQALAQEQTRLSEVEKRLGGGE
jgi:hypothetical protein